MDSVKSRIDEIQKDMDGTWSELRRQACRLASLATHLEDGPVTLISPSLRTSFLEAERSFNQVDGRKKARDELARHLSEGQEKVSRLQRERTESRRRLAQLKVQIGALAFAQAESPVCDKDVSAALSPFLAEHRRLVESSQASGLVGAMGRFRLSMYGKGQEKVFSSCFDTLFEKGLLDRLVGDKARDLLDAYLALSSSYEALDSDIEARSHRLSAGRMELDEDDDLDRRFRQARDDADEAGVSYGMYLFDNGSKWIGPDTPDSFLDCVQSMLALNEHIEECQRNIEREKEYSAIADFSSMIEFNDGKIRELRSEIERINGEIASIEEDNRSLRRKIANVKERMR